MAHTDEMLINGVMTPVTKFDQPAQRIDDAAGKSLWQANQNLIINPNFLDPVNQKGLTSWTASGQFVDGWNGTLVTGTTVELTESGLKITNEGSGTAYLRQKFEYPLPAGTYALSAKANSITGTITMYVGYEDGTFSATYAVYEGVRGVSITASKPITRVQLNIPAGGIVTLERIKLEYGSIQTLAHQDDNGDWVLNDPPPDKTLELSKCFRYFLPLETVRIRASRITTNNINYFIPTPVPMRAAPAIINSDYIKVCSLAGIIQSGFTLSVAGVSANGISLLATKEAHGLADSVLAVSGGTAYFDANL